MLGVGPSHPELQHPPKMPKISTDTCPKVKEHTRHSCTARATRGIRTMSRREIAVPSPKTAATLPEPDLPEELDTYDAGRGRVNWVSPVKH